MNADLAAAIGVPNRPYQLNITKHAADKELDICRFNEDDLEGAELEQMKYVLSTVIRQRFMRFRYQRYLFLNDPLADLPAQRIQIVPFPSTTRGTAPDAQQENPTYQHKNPTNQQQNPPNEVAFYEPGVANRNNFFPLNTQAPWFRKIAGQSGLKLLFGQNCSVRLTKLRSLNLNSMFFLSFFIRVLYSQPPRSPP